MDIQFYETFLIVAQTLNFRIASENLGIVQSTVSSRIQALEDFYECTLFNRKNKKVQITNSGKVLLPYARRIVKLQSEALEKTKNAKNFESKIRIGSEKSIYMNGVAEKLDLLSKEAEAGVVLTLNTSKQLYQMLVDNQLDVAYTYHYPQNKSIVSMPYRRDDLLLITNKLDYTDEKSVVHFDRTEKETAIKKENLVKLDMIYVPYSESTSRWMLQLFPEDYIWSLEIDPNADVIRHVVEQKKCAFVLKSHYKTHPMKAFVDIVAVENLNMPYFQSYILVKSDNKSILSKFIE